VTARQEALFHRLVIVLCALEIVGERAPGLDLIAPPKRRPLSSTQPSEANCSTNCFVSCTLTAATRVISGPGSRH
jgi:hypothetical protein